MMNELKHELEELVNMFVFGLEGVIKNEVRKISEEMSKKSNSEQTKSVERVTHPTVLVTKTIKPKTGPIWKNGTDLMAYVVMDCFNKKMTWFTAKELGYIGSRRSAEYDKTYRPSSLSGYASEYMKIIREIFPGDYDTTPRSERPIKMRRRRHSKRILKYGDLRETQKAHKGERGRRSKDRNR